jgi:hypothetical protein
MQTAHRFYTINLKRFFAFCEGQNVKNMSQITPGLIRDYVMSLGALASVPHVTRAELDEVLRKLNKSTQ